MTKRLAFLLLASVIVQLSLAQLLDEMGDLRLYRLWTLRLVRSGLVAAYWPPEPDSAGHQARYSAIDYPPVLPYVLLATARAYRIFVPGALQQMREVEIAVRLPLILAHLFSAVVVFYEARRLAGVRAGELAGAAVALNPALIFDTGYWGQADALLMLLALLAVALAARGRLNWAWSLATLAVLTKPLALPLYPVLVLVTLRSRGGPALLRGALAAAATCAVVLLPFALAGHLTRILATLILQVDVMPYASVNAHNLWWILTRGFPWAPADAPLVGVVSPRMLGLSVLAAFTAWTLVRLWCSQTPREIYLAVAGLFFGAFMLSTHMHENHNIPVLVFLAPVAFVASRRTQGLARLLFVLSLCVFINMAVNDPRLRELCDPYTPGPRLDYRLPAAHRLALTVEALHGSSLIRSWATLANALILSGGFIFWVRRLYRGRTFAEALSLPPPRPELRAWHWIAATAIVAGLAAPFVARTLLFIVP
jgi:Gpi18-like mannosyltransferase